MTTPDTSSTALARTGATVADDIVRHIERLIVTGTLASGDRLPAERVLAEELGVSRAALREALGRLEASGLVSRRPSEADGRGRYVALTTAGRELIDEAYAAHMRNEARLLGALSPSERAALERLLSQWLGDFES